MPKHLRVNYGICKDIRTTQIILLTSQVTPQKMTYASMHSLHDQKEAHPQVVGLPLFSYMGMFHHLSTKRPHDTSITSIFLLLAALWFLRSTSAGMANLKVKPEEDITPMTIFRIPFTQEQYFSPQTS